MIVTNPLPPQIDAALLGLLGRAEPATIGHFRHAGFMDPAIRGLSADVRIAGTAVPIRVPGFDGTIIHYALGHVRPGDVLVMDRCGDMRHAAFGGAACYAARCAGVAGIIVDGMVTDLGELRRYAVPVWARGPSPVTTKRLYQAGEFCVAISCGGVAVRPGDAILADENGVLVLAPTRSRRRRPAPSRCRPRRRPRSRGSTPAKSSPTSPASPRRSRSGWRSRVRKAPHE